MLYFLVIYYIKKLLFKEKQTKKLRATKINLPILEFDGVACIKFKNSKHLFYNL